MIQHIAVFKRRFLALMQQIQTAADQSALDLIDVRADNHWQGA